MALPRLSALRLSPDGKRLVVAVSRPDVEGKKMKTALWQVDPAGRAKPRRITRSAAGESVAAFARDGSLLLTSARPDPDVKEDTDNKINALWMLPAEGGEARLLLAPEGGIDGVSVAFAADAIAFGAHMHPDAKDLADDAARGKARRDAGVGALLFDDYPIRYWDSWLAPRRRRLFAAAVPALESDPETLLDPHDLTGPVSGGTLLESGISLSPDGRTLYTTWVDYKDSPRILEDLVAIDTATGERRYLTHGDAWYAFPKASPDGKYVACIRGTFGSPEKASDCTLWLFDLETGDGRDLIPNLDLWPEPAVWAYDSSALFFTADRDGGVAAIRVDLAGEVTILTLSGAVSELCPSPDGAWIYALQSTLSTPPRIVRFDAHTADQSAVELPNGIDEGGIAAGSLVERLAAKAADGTSIKSWLLLPPEASAEKPAPLVVFVHGGPLGTWAGWHWRWNAHLLTERGYAVLMPDPAISLGYGLHMIQRGWGDWGGAPFTDVMAATDSVLAQRKDLDPARTALMGGSFGGYMANWVAGKTDRFRCIITHASLWDLKPFHGTTDSGVFWEREIGDPYRQPENYIRQSPSENVGDIKTPMLVIHGEQDFRVPVSEALKLWTDLHRHGVEAKFLYFPDENHWILKPQNSRIWYATVLSFLDEHVLDKEWERPALL
jgi:dipeptidyl aminopeptidase/acylaminoacyl peptidase